MKILNGPERGNALRLITLTLNKAFNIGLYTMLWAVPDDQNLSSGAQLVYCVHRPYNNHMNEFIFFLLNAK